MKALLEFDGKIFYDDDLKASFLKLGVSKGDTLCVHTELFSFGKALMPKNEFLQSLLECFWQVLGENGTLLMPTFSYSFCKNEVYDKLNSRSTMGVLTEYFRKQKGVWRSNDPIFSFAVAGFKQKAFMKDYDSCFGKGCVYDTLTKQNGKIMFFGTLKLGCTFTHFTEETAGVSYRYFKEFSGKMIDENGKTSQKSIKYFVRALDRPSAVSVKKQQEIFEKTGNFKCLKFGGAPIALVDSQKYLANNLKAFKINENVMLRDL